MGRFQMKKILLLAIVASTALLSGCADKAENDGNPTFMFWCFRKEIHTDEFRVPDLKTAEQAAYIQQRLKSIPGYADSSWDLENHTFSVSYKSSTTRKMNFEEGIALSGFSANGRPANPKVKLPEGLK
jgi:hypothetical protein